MKFAQEFKKSLNREGFPQEWIDAAIPYGQLKKCIKKVARELDELGLDRDTLAKLASSQEGVDLGDHGFHYDLDLEADPKKHFRPRLTVFIHLKDGIAVDAQLTPTTRSFLEKLSTDQTRGGQVDIFAEELQVSSPKTLTDVLVHVKPGARAGSNSDIRKVEVPLIFDAEFFDILQADVSMLDALQAKEQTEATKEVGSLSKTIAQVTNPSGGKRAQHDREKWRAIFELYLDACIFFSTRESDHGSRTSAQAIEQLKWFQDQVFNRKLVQSLRLPQSRKAFSQFLALNATILQSLKFQEINRLAVVKILKKFDKRTSLGAARVFPGAMRPGRLLASSLVKDLSARISSELISCVPALDDYLCPICFSIAYWPIRLHCHHVFCSRCLVKMQRRGERHCPLCRGDVIMKAGPDNFDMAREQFLREYFPKEVKEKIKANELERGKEIFGPHYSDKPCVVM